MKMKNISKMTPEELQRYYECNIGSQTNQWKAQVALAEMDKRKLPVMHPNPCGGGGPGRVRLAVED